MLGPPADPWEHAEPLDYHAVHLDRTLAQRDKIGAEYAARGWVA